MRTIERMANWSNQGADAGLYSNEDIHAVRILAMEATTHRHRGNYPKDGRRFYSHAMERLRVLGEIPLRKFVDGEQPLDPDGKALTGFLGRSIGIFDPKAAMGGFANRCDRELPKISELRAILVGPDAAPARAGADLRLGALPRSGIPCPRWPGGVGWVLVFGARTVLQRVDRRPHQWHRR